MARLRCKISRTVVIVFSSYYVLTAETFFVSKSGHDDHQCQREAECATITRALRLAVNPGDVIQVAAGSYSERVKITRGGNETNPIVIRGHKGEGCPTETIDSDPNSKGERPNPEAETTGFSVLASHIKVDCFRVANTTGTGDTNSGIYVGPDQQNIEIRNNVIDGAETPGIPWAGIAFKGGLGPERMALGVRIVNNYIRGTGYGILMICKQCLAEGNEIERMRSLDGKGDNDYIRLFGEDIIVRENYLHGNRMEDCVNCHIDCFQTYNVGQSDNIARRVLIERNTCFEAHQGIIVRDVSTRGQGPAESHREWRVANNIFGYGPVGSRMPWCALFDHVGDVIFEHNLCVSAGPVGYRNGTNAIHRFNIHEQGGWKPYATGEGSTFTPSRLSASGNLLYQAGYSYKPHEWPQDLVNENPSFVDKDNRLFTIKNGSPAIDNALGSEADQDRIGTRRPQRSAPDIGPFEAVDLSSPAAGSSGREPRKPGFQAKPK